MTIGMLGDGLIAVLKSDGSYLELYEDKNDGFSNQTNAISENTRVGQWKTASLVRDECLAVLLCTDGVSDDLLPEQRSGFVRHIFERVHNYAAITLSREIRKMLENWPVPKHSDDKTLVCLSKYPEEKEA